MKISIITAAYNCQKDIANLVSCIEELDDNNFEWVVVDAKSSDSTLDVVNSAKVKRKKIISENDYGIYDALNKGVSIADGEYYLVLGADDIIYPDALKNFRASLEKYESDFVAASVRSAGQLLVPGRGGYWRRGGNAYIASHAVGTLIRRSLHAECGLYSNKFPNCADMYFILSCLKRKGKTIVFADFVSGEFGCEGVSSVDRATSITDAYRIYMAMGGSLVIGLLVLFYRLIRFS